MTETENKGSVKRIYHPYWLWEDWKNGFFETLSGKEREIKVQSCLEMFRSEELTRANMYRVIQEWKYSCEHNLTNLSMNRIAYIGQAACCIYDGIPSSVTMASWRLLSKEDQDRSDNIALEVIKAWEEQNKAIQLCLNFG